MGDVLNGWSLRMIIIFLSSIWSKIVGKYIAWYFIATISKIEKIKPIAATCPIPEKIIVEFSRKGYKIKKVFG